MAALIIEIPGRHGSQFHRVDKAVLRVGRALDNDIILSDPAVSPYHFVIRRTPAGGYELHSLADENGIRIGRQLVTEPLSLDTLPMQFDAGRTRIRILDSAGPVSATRLISCHSGSACLFGHWGWALGLFAGLVALSAVDNYLSTPLLLTWKSFWRDQVVIVMVALGLSLGMLLINRLASHRWDYPSSLSFVSLVLIIALLLDQLIPVADYFFTSPMPGFLVSLAWNLVLIPGALAWFLIRLNHGSRAAGTVIILLLCTPAAYLQIREIIIHYDLLNNFSKQAFYSESLYPWDRRLAPTVSIDEFTALNMQRLQPAKEAE